MRVPSVLLTEALPAPPPSEVPVGCAVDVCFAASRPLRVPAAVVLGHHGRAPNWRPVYLAAPPLLGQPGEPLRYCARVVPATAGTYTVALSDGAIGVLPDPPLPITRAAVGDTARGEVTCAAAALKRPAGSPCRFVANDTSCVALALGADAVPLADGPSRLGTATLVAAERTAARCGGGGAPADAGRAGEWRAPRSTASTLATLARAAHANCTARVKGATPLRGGSKGWLELEWTAAEGGARSWDALAGCRVPAYAVLIGDSRMSSLYEQLRCVLPRLPRPWSSMQFVRGPSYTGGRGGGAPGFPALSLLSPECNISAMATRVFRSLSADLGSLGRPRGRGATPIDTAMGQDVATGGSDALGAGAIRVLWEVSAAHLSAYGAVGGGGGEAQLRRALAQLAAALRAAPRGFSVVMASGVATSSGDGTHATTKRFTAPASRRNFVVGPRVGHVGDLVRAAARDAGLPYVDLFNATLPYYMLPPRDPNGAALMIGDGVHSGPPVLFNSLPLMLGGLCLPPATPTAARAAKGARRGAIGGGAAGSPPAGRRLAGSARRRLSSRAWKLLSAPVWVPPALKSAVGGRCALTTWGQDGFGHQLAARLSCEALAMVNRSYVYLPSAHTSMEHRPADAAALLGVLNRPRDAGTPLMRVPPRRYHLNCEPRRGPPRCVAGRFTVCDACFGMLPAGAASAATRPRLAHRVRRAVAAAGANGTACAARASVCVHIRGIGDPGPREAYSGKTSDFAERENVRKRFVGLPAEWWRRAVELAAAGGPAAPRVVVHTNSLSLADAVFGARGEHALPGSRASLHVRTREHSVLGLLHELIFCCDQLVVEPSSALSTVAALATTARAVTSSEPVNKAFGFAYDRVLPPMLKAEGGQGLTVLLGAKVKG